MYKLATKRQKNSNTFYFHKQNDKLKPRNLKSQKTTLNIKFFAKKSGIIMTEALMAVALMATAVIITGSITESTASTTKQSKDYTVAQNLLSETISVAENILNSNLILYPNTPACRFTINTDPCKTSNTPTTTDNYIIISKDNRWILENKQATGLDLSTDSESNENFRIYIQDKKIGEVTFPLYTHDNSKENIESPYYRSLRFLNISNEEATIEITIQWKDRSKIRTITSTFSI